MSPILKWFMQSTASGSTRLQAILLIFALTGIVMCGFLMVKDFKRSGTDIKKDEEKKDE